MCFHVYFMILNPDFNVFLQQTVRNIFIFSKFFLWSNEEPLNTYWSPGLSQAQHKHWPLCLCGLVLFPHFTGENTEEKRPESTPGTPDSLDITHSLGSWRLQEVLCCVCVGGCVLRHSRLIFLCYQLTAHSLNPQHLSNFPMSITHCRSTSHYGCLSHVLLRPRSV